MTTVILAQQLRVAVDAGNKDIYAPTYRTLEPGLQGTLVRKLWRAPWGDTNLVRFDTPDYSGWLFLKDSEIEVQA